MKLTCSQAALNSNLQCVSRAVASRPTHPVLANVLLQADEGIGKVTLTGFDLSLGIRTTFAAAVEQSGAITLPSRLLGDIVSRLAADSPLSLQSPTIPTSDSSGDEAGTSLSLQLTARTGAYTVRGMPAEDFPELPMDQSRRAIPLPAQSLRDGLARTLFAASSDEAKQILTGVHLVVSSDHLEFAATDGHRLAVLTQPNVNNVAMDHAEEAMEEDEEATDTLAAPEENGIAPAADRSSLAQREESFAVTIPARSLRELEHLLAARSEETVDLYHGQGQVVFLRADQVVTSRTLDGVYPKYNQLVPETFSRSFTVDRVLLLTALERVAVLADQQNSVVKLSVAMAERQLRVCAEVQDVGRGNESVPLVVGEGGDIDVAFNVRYLLDGLKVLPAPEVTFQLNEPVNPVVLRPQGGDVRFTYLVMPVQIRT
ncbi:MAG: DNA polymerase III subunit beta [Synechococcus sp. SB0676_bin_10]|uniref:DNA polymerase III subunit beta n=1 Tax=Synechococcus sp. SB0676_bin_10 TaxID=2604869 RepID=A0A6B1F3E1_9SYNE|nr:DNA polymerase III subunit beta [Cyanobacteria bacterium MAG IRC3_bin_20]MDE0648600.1 DNA polymerase III subunit beta [Cyanobacteria bacterium MAG IRC4_bin_6]MXY18854.1 DNA polymerase III subunit beta [Synechococcus sp. SB0664_bin_36]MYG37481.1 DNA polymerase III subunit beta [Synechococcus sp. SB0676_bin_10]MYK07703.1 DNA polymerase III subunit beta [Synechococcus sp. SB0670_bin_20]